MANDASEHLVATFHDQYTRRRRIGFSISFRLYAKFVKFMTIFWLPNVSMIHVEMKNYLSFIIIQSPKLSGHVYCRFGLFFMSHTKPFSCRQDILQTNNLQAFYLEILKQWQITKDCTETLHTQDNIIWNNQKMANRYFSKAGSTKTSYESATSFKKRANSYRSKTFVLNLTWPEIADI